MGPRMGAPERFGDHAREPPPSLLGIHVISLVTLNPQQELGKEDPHTIICNTHVTNRYKTKQIYIEDIRLFGIPPRDIILPRAVLSIVVSMND